MDRRLIVAIIFVIVMLGWAFELLGGTFIPPAIVKWLPFIAVAILAVYPSIFSRSST